MNNTISHYGVVEEIADGRISVRISQQSACSLCKVAGACHASDRKEKIVDVYDSSDTTLKPGDAVVVSTNGSVGRKAVLIAYTLPLIILMTAILAGKQLLDSDAAAALLGLGCLAPYFVGLYLLRHRLQSVLKFSISRATS